MNADKLLQTIQYYLSNFKSESDKLSQFYSSCIIAREALLQVKIDNRDLLQFKSETDDKLYSAFLKSLLDSGMYTITEIKSKEPELLIDDFEYWKRALPEYSLPFLTPINK